MKQYVRFVWLLLILLLLACEEKSTNPDNYPNILSQNTHLISTTDINQNAITITESTLIIQGGGALKHLDTGDIIIVGPNNFSDKGFFLKIISKQTTNNEITLTTEKARLTEAFTNLDVEEKIQLTSEDIREIELNNSSYSSDDERLNFNVDGIVYDRDNDITTTDDQVKFTGTLSFELALELELEIENNLLEEYQLNWDIDKDINLNIVTGSTVYEDMDNLMIDIADISYSPQLILIDNIPLVITPKVHLSVALDGELMVKFASNISYSESSESGLEYDSGLWNNINSNDHSFSLSELPENNELDFTQKTSILLALDLFNSEITSIIVVINLIFEVQYYATQDNSNNLKTLITASQQVSSDFKMQIISPLLADKFCQFLAYEQIIIDDYSPMDTPADMAFVPGGAFIMGNTRGAEVEEELTPHQVFLSPFFMCIHEVTQGEYSAIMGENPSSLVCTEWPVEKVSRSKAYAYCNLLSIEENREPTYTYDQDGTDPNTWSDGWTDSNNVDNFTCDFTANGYRLPTEAEWEYAARGATNEPDYIYSGSDNFSNVVGIGIWEHWWGPGAGEGYYLRGYSDVCSRNANSLGIYDMSGSVWEMCWDYYALYNTEFQVNPTGPESGINHVLRGGSVENIIEDRPQCQVIYRGHFSETVHPPQCIGFRVVMNADQDNLGGNND